MDSSEPETDSETIDTKFGGDRRFIFERSFIKRRILTSDQIRVRLFFEQLPKFFPVTEKNRLINLVGDMLKIGEAEVNISPFAGTLVPA